MKQIGFQKSIRKFVGNCPLWEPSGKEILKCVIRSRYIETDFIWLRIQSRCRLLGQLGGSNSSRILL